jgi:predicted ATPase
MLRDEDGRPQTFGAQLDLNESVLSQLAEPHRYPVLSTLRERVRRWRFYHQIRTDVDSPVRAVQIGSRTAVLAHDGHDLAPALQTIIEIGNDRALADAVSDAFGDRCFACSPTRRCDRGGAQRDAHRARQRQW